MDSQPSNPALPPPGWRGGRHRASRVDPPEGGKRNLPLAVGVGLVLASVTVMPLVVYPPVFAAVAALAVGVALWELTSALHLGRLVPPRIPLTVGGAGTVALAWFTGIDGLVVGVLLTILATAAWRLADGVAGFGRDVAASTLAVVYVPLMGGFLVLLAGVEDGPIRVLIVLSLIVCSDTAGFVVGTLWGRRKLAPIVSPGKTWEGTAGSVLACAATGAVVVLLALGEGMAFGALCGVAIAAAATLGDLAESLIKRDLRIKDMGNILPGHGGLMDRLDSVLAAAPVGYLLLS